MSNEQQPWPMGGSSYERQPNYGGDSFHSPILHSAEDVGDYMNAQVKSQLYTGYVDGGSYPYLPDVRKAKTLDRPEPSVYEPSGHSNWLTFAAVCSILEALSWAIPIIIQLTHRSLQ